MNKISKIILCLMLSFISVFSIPSFNKYFIDDVNATALLGCDPFNFSPTKCTSSIIIFVTSMYGIASKVGIQDMTLFSDDVQKYVEEGGIGLTEKWGVTSEGGSISMSQNGMLTAYQDLVSFMNSNSLPWLSGDVIYNSDVKSFVDGGFLMRSRTFLRYETVYLNNNSSFLYYDLPSTIGQMDLSLFKGTMDIKYYYLSFNSQFSTHGFGTRQHSLYGIKTGEIFLDGTINRDIRHLNLTSDLVFSPLLNDVYPNKKGDEVLTLSLTSNNGSSSAMGENGDVIRYLPANASGYRSINRTEFANMSTALNSNLVFGDLPLSESDILNSLNFADGKFLFQGFDLLLRDYRDFLEQIPLIKEGSFVETIPLPTPIPTAVPTTPPVYPPSVPFPTAPSLDWAESIPLPDVNLPMLGDGTVTGKDLSNNTSSSLSWFGGAINALIGSIGNMFTGSLKWLESIFNGVLALPSQIALSLSALFENLGALVLSIPLAIEKAFSSVIEFVNAFWANLTNFFSWLLNPNDSKVKPLFDDLFLDKFKFFNQFTGFMSSLNVDGVPFEYYIDFMGTQCLIISTKWFEGHNVMIRNGFKILFNFGLILSLYKLLTSMFGLHQSKGDGE